MSVAIVTGSCGLIGSETARFFSGKGFEIVGIDNNMRKAFFGPDGDVTANRLRLQKDLGKRYRHAAFDIRNETAVNRLLKRYGADTELIVHTAAQPSHDWAAREPLTDFTVNANGTLLLLEACRRFCPKAVFIFTSTNKVYGDRPNELPLQELETRYEIPENHPYREGIDESMSIDTCLHSLFGASKAAADLLAQEYGRYFGLKTGIFRGGCLTGPAHSGAEQHGFLSYLVKCLLSGRVYRIYGYKAKQVRDNIHAHDLVEAFFAFFQAPRPGEVYNMGGGRFANCSITEAIRTAESLAAEKMKTEYVPQNRKGDHLWYISGLRKFQQHFPSWRLTYTIERTITEIIEAERERLPRSRA